MLSILNTNLADRGFYINLDESKDRRVNVENQKIKYGICELDRFKAIKDPLHQASATASQLEVFKLANNMSLNTIGVFEDDFEILNNSYILEEKCSEKTEVFLELLSKDIIDNNINWDVLLLGFNPKKPCIPVSLTLSRVFKSTGAWSYLIKKRAWNFILDNFNYYSDRQAIDDILPYLSFHGFDVFATNVQVCHHGVGFVSTLQPDLGPIDYSQWIYGNYYRYMWNSLKEPAEFQELLHNNYQNSQDIRENKILFKKFTGDTHSLNNFLEDNPNFTRFYSELEDNYNINNVGYYLNAECPHLIYPYLTSKSSQFLKNLHTLEVSLK